MKCEVPRMTARSNGWMLAFCLSLSSGFAQPVNADRHMTLDVAVTDKSGKPVPGLQEADFTLLDNKQPEKILSFRAAEGAAAPDPPVEVVLLVDEVNTSFTRVAFVFDQIEKFLRRDGGDLPRPYRWSCWAIRESTSAARLPGMETPWRRN